MLRFAHRARRFGWVGALAAAFVVMPALGPLPTAATAQEEGAAPAAGEEDPEELADEALGDQDAESEGEGEEAAVAPEDESKELNILELLVSGGYLMIPILLMSVVVVTFGVERAIALRRSNVVPDELVEGFGEMSERKGRFDPREAYRICQRYPSAAANVIRRALLKVGRPLAEVEHAAHEAAEREGTRLYSNVRPISLAMAISPLLGLLGTVWGMIQAFFVTASLPVGANKAEHLAEGIYVALVTTFSGLMVAIPAAILAHYFEGRIQNLFHDIDDLMQSLMPQLERYEGRMRVSGSRKSEESDDEEGGKAKEKAKDEGKAAGKSGSSREPATTPK